MKPWYEELFENYAETYDREEFTRGTIGECDFIEKEIHYDKTKKILDIGCGTGRHSVELSKRGYSVTGIDLSETQLRRARQKAAMQSLAVIFENTMQESLISPMHLMSSSCYVKAGFL